MPAPVRFEACTWTDARFATLGRLIGKDEHSARSRVGLLWAQCTKLQTYSLSAAVVAGVLECDVGTAATVMMQSELGEVLPDGKIRIRGTLGRIEWLGKRVKAGSAGGRASAKARAEGGSVPKSRARKPKLPPTTEQPGSKPEANPKQTGSTTEATAKPLISDLLSINSDLLDQSCAPSAAPASDHHGFIRWFTERYETHHRAKPTWDGKTTSAVKALLARHPVSELQRRAEVMFAMAPEWPATHPDIATLRQHFDKLTGVQPRGSPGTGHFKVTGKEKYQNGIVKL